MELEGRLWYRTGDIVRVDPDGFVAFVDRAADVIKHKGYRRLRPHPLVPFRRNFHPSYKFMADYYWKK